MAGKTKEIIDKLINILQTTGNYLKLPTIDLGWSKYDNVQELLEELDRYIQVLQTNDLRVVDDLKLLFAPTGWLQEIFNSSSWAMEFLILAERFDKTIDRLEM